MSPTSPYSRKVRIVLREKRIACEEIDHNASERKPGTVNPLAKVPTLVLDEHTALFDSVVIAEALDALYPEPQLIPSDPRERIVVRRWEALADGLCDVLIPVVLERRRPAEKCDELHVGRLEGKVRETLRYFERHIGNGPYLHGGKFTLADAAVVSALGYVALRRPDFLEGCDRSQAYAARLSVRPSIADTAMPNLPVRG